MSKKKMTEEEVIERLSILGISEYEGKNINTVNFSKDELVYILNKETSEKEVKKDVPPELPKEKTAEMIEITPLKDWLLHCPPHIANTQLKEGVTASVPVIVISSLKTSKVID